MKIWELEFSIHNNKSIALVWIVFELLLISNSSFTMRAVFSNHYCVSEIPNIGVKYVALKPFPNPKHNIIGAGFWCSFAYRV